MQTDILIIGGGASGLTAAISAKDARPDARVCVIESLPRCGKKLLATGNGRCNLMNVNARAEDYAGNAAFISPALKAYMDRYESFWERLGLSLMQEEGGRVYPACNQASTVLDVLRLALADRGITEITELEARALRPDASGFTVETNKSSIHTKKVILASGSSAGRALGVNDSFRKLLAPLGHTFTPVYPALTYLTVPRECVAGLNGVRLRGEIALLEGESELARETGEILFRDGALSGIAAMQLSLVAAGRKNLYARLSPLAENAYEILNRRRSAFSGREAAYLTAGCVNRLIALLALKRSGISPAVRAGDISDMQLKTLARELSDWRVPISGTGDFANAQVMLGGADTAQFDAGTLESLCARGLYACGELLNVTGPCGGYNLGWAWASGMRAGRSAAFSL